MGTASVRSSVMSSAATALVTSTIGGAPVTTTVSVMLPIGSVMRSDAVCPARTSTPSRRTVRNPCSSTVTR